MIRNEEKFLGKHCLELLLIPCSAKMCSAYENQWEILLLSLALFRITSDFSLLKSKAECQSTSVEVQIQKLLFSSLILTHFIKFNEMFL